MWVYSRTVCALFVTCDVCGDVAANVGLQRPTPVQVYTIIMPSSDRVFTVNTNILMSFCGLSIMTNCSHNIKTLRKQNFVFTRFDAAQICVNIFMKTCTNVCVLHWARSRIFCCASIFENKNVLCDCKAINQTYIRIQFCICAKTLSELGIAEVLHGIWYALCLAIEYGSISVIFHQ